MKKMKKETIWRTLGIFIMLLVSVLWLGAAQVSAAELKTENGDTQGVLQNGGLLVRKAKGDVSSYALANQSEIEQALKDAWDNLADSTGGEIVIDVSRFQAQVSDMNRLIAEVLDRNPRYFYIRSWQNTYYLSSGVVVRIRFPLQESTADLQKKMAAYDAEVRSIKDMMDPSWSPLETALFVNDYLTQNCRYDQSLTKYSAYDVFVEKTAVCQGYALAFLELMNQAGVACELVTSDELNHAWNLVKIGNAWYHVDTTWNDPVPNMIGWSGHDFLLKSTGWFQDDSKGRHNSQDYAYTGNVTDASASSQTYDDYFWNDINAPFGFYKGYWYGNDGGAITQYKGSPSGLSVFRKVKTIEGTWHVLGETSFYRGNFSGFALYLGKIYYLLPTEIHVMNCDGTSDRVLYTLSASEQEGGYLYAFSIDPDGRLTYGTASKPYVDITERLWPGSLHTHSYGAWAVRQAATCMTGGSRVRTCPGCGRTEWQMTARMPHNYQKVQKAATCTEAGYTAQVCAGCKREKDRQDISPRGHVHQTKKRTEPTFKKTGTESVVCTDCGKALSTKTLAKKVCKKGQKYQVGNYKYKIISPKINGKGTVAFTGLAKNTAKVTVGNTVKINGASFKIVQVGDKALKGKTKVTSVTIGTNVRSIGKEAFSGAKKLKTITVKSKVITKVGKNAFKNIYKRAKIKVPKVKLKAYQKLFKKKGQSSKVKITR